MSVRNAHMEGTSHAAVLMSEMQQNLKCARLLPVLHKEQGLITNP